MASTIEQLHDSSAPTAAEPFVVAIAPSLFVGNRQRLKQDILDAIYAGTRKFVFDFSNTGYIDTTGLGVLVSISKQVRDAHGALVLCGLNEDLRLHFEMTKLDTLFAIVDTRDRALEYIATIATA